MKNILSNLLFLFLISGYAVCQQKTNPSDQDKIKLEQLKKAVYVNLTENILPYWSGRMVDNINGGFYGRADFNDRIYPDAEKGGIMNARILWTFSSAYRVLQDTSYLRMATRARDYILAHFIDGEYGGAYRSVDPKGGIADGRKQTYTQAFFIYGLAEYSRATGDKESLGQAMEIFKLFEKYALDKKSNGYFEVFSRDWKRLNDRLIGESDSRDEKTMNTHLHVMEAYANLFRVSRDKYVGDRLRNIVELFLDRIVDKKTGHLICFMDRDWNPTSEVDSYGHDIEASWLLYEAAGLLDDKDLLGRVRETCIKIANAASQGLEPDGGMLTEKDRATGSVRKIRSWWEQSETVVGNLNAFELTGDSKYLDRSVACWNFIRQHFVDTRNGGWYSNINEDGTPGRSDKAGFWICPYHNGRMCMEVIERVTGF